MPLYSLLPSNLLKLWAARSRPALLHKIVTELDLVESRAKSPQDLPGVWQAYQTEPIPLIVPRGAWRVVSTGRRDYHVRLRNNHVNGRGFATQEVWIQAATTELYIEIGIQGLRIRLDGVWVAKIIRRRDPKNGRESIKITGHAEQSTAHMSRLANLLTSILAPLNTLAEASEVKNSRSTVSGVGGQFVTVRRQSHLMVKSGSRVIHLS